MFIHQSQLRHVLRPAQYADARQLQVELDRLFLPAWHFVATRADLPRDGDYLTLELLGRPLLVRNHGGELHAFLNVCAHRHCMLTHQRRGHDPHFRCQYHGWEYNEDGRTGRIPEARCFRPWDRENARLHKFPLQMCGELAFIRLADDGPDLADYLGPYHAACCAAYAPPYRQAWTWEATYDANWKVPIENSLESYHVPQLHTKSFGAMPQEERCEHELNERYTTFRTPVPDGPVTAVAQWLIRRLGVSPQGTYTHRHIHPHLTFVDMDSCHMAQMMLPLTPTRTLHMVRLYTLHGTRRGPGRWLLGRALRWAARRLLRQVVLEDAPIFADVQRGLAASVHPGVIGTREERLYVFQQYVASRCGDPTADPECAQGLPADGQASGAAEG
jgi:phenylpropionate dioxygenase-like ring-hydroxylating dioxygenase large terminal subunit